MVFRAAQMLVAARRASPFPARQLHSPPSSSTRKPPYRQRLLFSHKVGPPQENPSPSFNLWAQIREVRPALRYTVYAGLGLIATAESTFWFSVIKAKYFPSVCEEEQEKSEQFLQDLRAVAKGYKVVWVRNYGRYYGSYIWGLEYVGLDQSE